MNIDNIRKEFPILDQDVNGKKLIYFDNAATSQKPERVIDALTRYYYRDNANIHRGVHALAARATEEYEGTREVVKDFINAKEKEEIVFTSGTTESINLVAQAYGRKFLKEGDEILITAMEHHSNIVPWQMLAKQTGAVLQVVNIDDEGELMQGGLEHLLSSKTKIVSFVYISNSLGTVNPAKKIVEKSQAVGAKVMIDAAQAAPHEKIDVQNLGCDFLAFSAHKMYGPTGTGVLYGKRELLESMDPYQGGGEMIKEVTFKETTYNDIPHKFEAGTPNIADVVALKEAIGFINDLGHEDIKKHEIQLLEFATERMSKVQGFKAVGTAKEKAPVLSFVLEDVHPYDLGMFLDAKGIAVRTGHHCTQPVMDRYKLDGTVRASFAVYNTIAEIDTFALAVEEIIKRFERL